MTAVEDGVLGRIEFLADADRPGGWLLTVDRIRQSYVDLDDPTYLDFEYVRVFGDVVDLLPAGPLTVTHVGGGACTLVRYVAHTRPGSRQIVLEPDEALITQVRARLPFGRGVRVRIRPVDGRTGITALGDASADLVVLDAFHGGRVPYELTSREFVTQAARVLRPDGVLLVNIADGPPMRFTRRLVNTIRTELPELLAVADPSVLKGRRFGNVVLVASPSALPADELRRVAARAPFPRIVHGGAQLVQFAGGAPELSDADPMRSPEPPDALWRVGEGDWD
ncbi:MAG: fused MFS/spermidine synthase [Actinomycetota bacterium]|nr:fused MFS/spermidine synthase [Actinomycetota bacterium]